MKMTFAQAWGLLAVGDVVTVSNGVPPPPEENGRAYNLWRACNFDGVVEALEAGDPPRIRIGFEADFGSIALHVADSPGLTIDVTDPIELTEARTAGWDAILHARIDAEAGAVRMRFITDCPGQELTYQRKETEARAWMAAPETPLTSLPFLSAEMAATGDDAASCAATIIAAADAWAAIGSAIEGARIAGKRAVSAAATASAKETAAIVDWEAATTIWGA